MKRLLYIILLNILTIIYAESNLLDITDIVELLLENSYTANISRSNTEVSRTVYEEVLGRAKPTVRFTSDPYSTPLYSFNNYLTDTHNLSGELQLSNPLPTGGNLNFGIKESFTISKNMEDEWDTELEPTLSISLYQPLFLNRKLIDLKYAENSRRGFEIDYEIAILNEIEIRNQLILGVLSSIHNLNILRNNITILTKRLEQLEKDVITTREDRDLGRVSTKDVLNIELRYAKQQEVLFDLLYNRELTQLNIESILGLENLDEYSFNLNSNIDEKFSRDIERNINQLINKLDMEKSELLNGRDNPGSTPDINMFFSTNENFDISFGLGFNVDIYDGGVKKSKRERDNLSTEIKRESFLESVKETKKSIKILESRIKLLKEKTSLLNRNIEYDRILLESERDLLSLGSSTEDNVKVIELDVLSKELDLNSIGSEITLLELELISLYGTDLSEILKNRSIR